MKQDIAYFPFSEKQAGEAVAYILRRIGPTADKLKVVRLLYLADRESFRRHGAPICGGEYFSLPHGPVVSKALDLLKTPSTPGIGWSIKGGPDTNSVTLNTEIEFDYLSRDDISVLDEVIARFAPMKLWDLGEHLHALPEYTKPEGRGRLPLPTSELLRGVGLSEDKIAIIRRELAEQRAFDRTLEEAGN